MWIDPGQPLQNAPPRAPDPEKYAQRQRVDSLFSLDSENWDLITDIEQAKLRGCAFLGTFVLCVFLFFGGLAFPLVEVVILPGSKDMEKRIIKSVMSMITLAFQQGEYLGGAVMTGCTVGIPIMLFLGMAVIMYENFFAVGFGWNTCFSPSCRSLMVSIMTVLVSYQVVMIFLIVLFTCFFTGFGSHTNLRAGFHFLAAYCLASIGMLQAMEFLRVEKRHDYDNLDDLGEAPTLPSITGFQLRRRFSSFFPSLPGIKEIDHVDAFQVFFFQILFLALLLVGYNQPLLDIRVMYKGIALERIVLSFQDIITHVFQHQAIPVSLLFFLFTVVLPVTYGFTLVVAGIFELFRICCGDMETCNNILLTVAQIQRPWVMIDVFSIALMIVLCAVQNEYVSATIPDGMIHVGPNGLPSLVFGRAAQEAAADGTASRVYWLHFFSGIYLIVGAGIAVIFLRFFWSSNAGEREAEKQAYIAGEQVQEPPQATYGPVLQASPHASPGHSRQSSTVTEIESEPAGEIWCCKYVAGKSCRCLTAWTLICWVLHFMPIETKNFELTSMNAALQRSIPTINKMVTKYSPQTVGYCKYPPPPGQVPQPCFEYGYLDKLILQPSYRVTAMWMSGLRSLRLSNISISRHRTLASGVPVGWNATSKKAVPSVLHRFVLEIDGVYVDPSMFLKIEECPKNHTSLKAIIGQGLCKPFLDTGESCCEKDRKFKVKIATECHVGDKSLANLRVQEMKMDTMTVRPRMFKGNVKVLIADKNITQMVLDTVKENMMFYLTKEPLLKNFTGEDMNMMQFLNRVLRFNAAHQEFHCR